MGRELIVMSRSSAISLSHQDLPPPHRGLIGFEPSAREDAASLRLKGGQKVRTRQEIGMVSPEFLDAGVAGSNPVVPATKIPKNPC
jgi:hypothetical protein